MYFRYHLVLPVVLPFLKHFYIFARAFKVLVLPSFYERMHLLPQLWQLDLGF